MKLLTREAFPTRSNQHKVLQSYIFYVIYATFVVVIPLNILFSLQNRSYLMMACLMVSTMYATSSSLTIGPEGRHMPILNSDSLTPLI